MAPEDSDNRVQVVSTFTIPESLSRNLKSLVAWLVGKDASTPLLYLLVFGMAWFGRWLVTIGIPVHIEQIQRGYQEQTERFFEERQRDREERDRERAYWREWRESLLKHTDLPLLEPIGEK